MKTRKEIVVDMVQLKNVNFDIVLLLLKWKFIGTKLVFHIPSPREPIVPLLDEPTRRKCQEYNIIIIKKSLWLK